MHQLKLIVWTVVYTLIALALIGLYALSQFNLSALNEPGPAETKWATRAKLWYVSRAVRAGVPPAPKSDSGSQMDANMAFMNECSTCHGMDGRTPSNIGRWMYPRTLDLTSPEVQGWSDAELFWVIKNGIRLSGMPAFGKTKSEAQVWQLVYYVRSLTAAPKH